MKLDAMRLSALSPICCLRDHSQEDEPPLIKVLPPLLLEAEKINDIALRCLYHLSNEKNGINRIPMLCCGKWDVLSPLIKCLMSNNTGNARHLACLTLANLSIPIENKAVMALGHLSASLFSALYYTIQQQAPEAYISCMCLVNISYLKDAIHPLFLFTPSKPFHEELSPLENPHSACRTIENLIQTCKYPPINATIQSEAVRWACVLLKNITTSEKICKIITKTKIPIYVVRYLEYTKQPIVRWTNASVEDSSLQIILNLSKFSDCKKSLVELKTSRVLEPIIGQGGIHDYRATVISLSLNNEKQF